MLVSQILCLPPRGSPHQQSGAPAKCVVQTVPSEVLLIRALAIQPKPENMPNWLDPLKSFG